MTANPAQLDIRRLPSLPRAVSETQRLLREPEPDLRRVTQVISTDPGLSLRLLRLANSPFYSAGRKITDLRQAAVRIGLRTLQNAVVTSWLRGHTPTEAFDSGGYWRHCEATAVAAGLLAERLPAAGVDAATAYSGGLLHDTGKLCIALLAPQYLDRLVVVAGATDPEHLALERELLGQDHAQIAGRALRHWELPADIVAAATWHHQPDAAPDQPLVRLVHVADALAQGLQVRPGSRQRVSAIDPAAWAALGMDSIDLPGLLAEIEAGVERLEAQAGAGSAVGA